MDGHKRSERERLELTVTALVPAALGMLAVPASAAGRGACLCPVLALPAGLWLCRVWRRLGELPRGLERCFGVTGGKAAALAYLLWGGFLLAENGRRCARRLLLTVGEGGSPWLFLGVILALALWLGRREDAFARTGRIFFLAVTVTLAAVLILALPGLRWENLLPVGGRELAGVPFGSVWVLSLSGYGVYGLCLPAEGRGETRPGRWTVWSCGGLSVLTLAVVGAFGPALVLEMDEPFLYLLGGVGLPGAFQRGEAALAAVLALGDLTLLTLLSWGCGRLWRELLPGRKKSAWVPAAVGLLAAGLIPAQGGVSFWTERIAPAGNLIFGVLLPAGAVLTEKCRKYGKGKPTSCGESSP